MQASTSRQLTHLSALAVLSCVLVYTVALGTGWGLDLDGRGLPATGASEPTWAHAHADLRRAFLVGTIATIALAAVAAVLVAARRQRRNLAAVSIALIGASATTYLLKPLLARADPLGGEAARGIDASFPSGHATAAMSLALVAVIVAPPRRRRRVALVAAGYAGCIGVGLVALAYHYPSDVLGGYLVAIAWFSALTAIILARCEQRATALSATPMRSVRAIVGAAVLAIASGALLVLPATQVGHGMFALFALAIAGIAVLPPLGLTAILGRERKPGSSHG